MSNSVHSIQSTVQHDRNDQSVQPPKTQQQKAETQPLQDKVTLSNASRQGRANRG